MDVKQQDKTYVAPTYGRADVTFTRGKGSLLWDDNGKEYIDFCTGIAVNGLGIAEENWLSAVTAQLNALPHASNLYHTAPQAELAELLVTKTGMKNVFFANSGAEANECAIKCARKYSYDKYGKGRHKIVTLVNSFHGRTLATITATGQDVFHKFFDPFVDGFAYATAGDYDAFVKESENAAAVMLELVQGEGGVMALDPDYVKKVVDYCHENDILVVCDEVQTGNGRTGALYAFERYGFTPDIFTTAKGLGNGLPIGACVMGEKTAGTLVAGTHGSTFGGNPVCAAGAVAVLKQIDQNLLDGVLEREKMIRDALATCKKVKSVSGLGLMLGIEVDGDAKEVVEACRKRGLIVLTAKTKVRLLPALNIPLDLLNKGLQILTEVLS